MREKGENILKKTHNKDKYFWKPKSVKCMNKKIPQCHYLFSSNICSSFQEKFVSSERAVILGPVFTASLCNVKSDLFLFLSAFFSHLSDNQNDSYQLTVLQGIVKHACSSKSFKSKFNRCHILLFECLSCDIYLQLNTVMCYYVHICSYWSYPIISCEGLLVIKSNDAFLILYQDTIFVEYLL